MDGTSGSRLEPSELLDYALPFPPGQFTHFHDQWVALTALTLGDIAFVDRPLYDYVQHGEAVLGHARANQITVLRERLASLPTLHRNVRERVGQLYGRRAQFSLTPAIGGGTLATLRLPFIHCEVPHTPVPLSPAGSSMRNGRFGRSRGKRRSISFGCGPAPGITGGIRFVAMSPPVASSIAPPLVLRPLSSTERPGSTVTARRPALRSTTSATAPPMPKPTTLSARRMSGRKLS